MAPDCQKHDKINHWALLFLTKSCTSRSLLQFELHDFVYQFQLQFSACSRVNYAFFFLSLESTLIFRGKSLKKPAPQVATRLRRAATMKLRLHFFSIFLSWPWISEFTRSTFSRKNWEKCNKGPPCHRSRCSAPTAVILWNWPSFVVAMIWRKNLDWRKVFWLVEKYLTSKCS